MSSSFIEGVCGRVCAGQEKPEDGAFLQDVLTDNTLQQLLQVYACLQKYRKHHPVPLLKNSCQLVQKLTEQLNGPDGGYEARELANLLSQPQLQALLEAHDTVALNQYDPCLPPDSALKEEDAVRIISLLKNQKPLGATIKIDQSTGAVVVARIMRGGAADQSGLIHEGDKLEEVNGVPVNDKNFGAIQNIISLSEGAAIFKIIPGNLEEPISNDTKIFVRALCDYDPKSDPAIPCKEAGLEFWRGDVLEVVRQDDEVWWQARRINNPGGEAKISAGLIPSLQLQERRVALQRPKSLFHPPETSATTAENTEDWDVDYSVISGIYIAGMRRSFRLSRKDQRNEARQRIQRAVYQPVQPYQRKPGDPHRLVLLTGPSGVGVTELKKKLLVSDPEHFSVAVPHTTREQKKLETQGVNYHFISRQTFETEILTHKFLWYSENNGNYYGLHLDAVRRVLADGRVCLLDVKPHEIAAIYTSEFKPFVVFVKPPPLDRLRLSRRKADRSQTPAKTSKEEDFEMMLTSAQAMEKNYGHFFEKIIINDDLALAFTELKAELEKIEVENHWISASWAQAGDRNEFIHLQ